MVMPVPDAAPVVVNVTESADYIEPVRLVQFSPTLVAVVVAVVLAFFLVCFAASCMRKCIRLVDVERGEIKHHKQCGLDPDVLAALPHVEYKDLSAADKDLECPVCLVTFDANDNLRLLPPCSHVFHSECIDSWFKSHTTCPLCRACLLPKEREGDAEDGHEQAEIRVDVVEVMVIGGNAEQDRSGRAAISTPVLSISKSLQERTGGAKISTVESSVKERGIIAHPFLRSFSSAGAFKPAVRVGIVPEKEAAAVAFLRRSNSDLQLPHSCSYVVDSEGTQHNRNRPQAHVIDVEEFLLDSDPSPL